jgi:hypothetical protein
VLGEDGQVTPRPTGRRAVRRLLAGPVLLLVLAASACQGGAEEPAGDAAPTTEASPDAAAEDAEPAPPPFRPDTGACYRLSYDAAVAPTNESRPLPCRREHTAVTFHVGSLRTVVDGHLVAVDSERVRAQVAEECPRRLDGFLGGSEEDRRLSMLSTVWFSPTVEASDAGENWFRCDVVALAGPERLAPLGGNLRGVLGRPEGRDRYGVCGTADPDADDFQRVICSRPHTWRAVSTVGVPAGEDGSYPGAAAARSAGEGTCEDVGRAQADDPLDFTWGYEWPTAAQWADGQRYGLCWVPAD